MGYRHYFQLIKIEEHNIIKDLDPKAFEEYYNKNYSDDYMDVFSILDEEVFEFGKLYYENTAEDIYAKGVPLFNNNETQNLFDDYQPYVVGKEGIREAIKIYKNKIIDYLKQLHNDGETHIIRVFGYEVNDDTVKKEDKQKEDISTNALNWVGSCPYNSSDTSNDLSNSFLYEYQIFNLINLLKTIDWSEYTLVFLGW